jgi:hypothetical protein
MTLAGLGPQCRPEHIMEKSSDSLRRKADGVKNIFGVVRTHPMCWGQLSALSH